jgi:hypothetical protein
MLVLATYAVYLLISVALTIWVARVLTVHGRVFLVRHMGGDAHLAESLNRLLVIGFYLLNLGYVSLALSLGRPPVDEQQAVEYLSTKVGLVLMVLGGMHLFNMFVISRVGRRWDERQARNPVGAALDARNPA